jgi:hypothetical protein
LFDAQLERIYQLVDYQIRQMDEVAPNDRIVC